MAKNRSDRLHACKASTLPFLYIHIRLFHLVLYEGIWAVDDIHNKMLTSAQLAFAINKNIIIHKLFSKQVCERFLAALDACNKYASAAQIPSITKSKYQQKEGIRKCDKLSFNKD
jgi:hypothetical protein